MNSRSQRKEMFGIARRSANRDWELIFAMFHRQIPP